MKVLILQVSLCSTVEWFATFALLRFKEYLHQFRFAQFANKALSNTYFAILALLELCKIICFPSLCSGTKYISKARSARFANKVSFRFNFYGPANFVYMLPFTTRWIKKYILYIFFTTLVNAWACQSHDQLPFSLNLNSVNKKLHCAIPIDPFNSNGCTANFVLNVKLTFCSKTQLN